MFRMTPLVFFILTFALLISGSLLGAVVRKRRGAVDGQDDEALKTLEGALLALLGLLLGFTFSMALTRFEERKQLQIAEANDLGTLWLRTSLLSPAGRDAERAILRNYLPVRIQFLDSGTSVEAYNQSQQRTGELQNQMWHVATTESATRRDAETGLFVAALNDSIDDTEKRTAALENRIPVTTWAMLLLMGTVATVFMGLGLHLRTLTLRLVLPFVLTAVLALTYDLDSPRSGLIRVEQTSMQRVLQQVNSVPVD
jgi:hypothetical protein